jgi:hypothetical protein
VYYCNGVAEAKEHARRGHCVAVSLGINRVPGDLVPPRRVPDRDRSHTVGRIIPGPPPPPRRPWWKFW